jgi:hypothetical protein
MRIVLTAAAVVLVIALSSAAAELECHAPSGTFNVSFPRRFQVPAGERIVGFELSVTSADVVGMTRIPQGWSMKLDADKASRKISGFIQQGKRAILATTELPAFTIAVDAIPPAEHPFQLEGIVYTSSDLETYVRHRFRCSDLLQG